MFFLLKAGVLMKMEGVVLIIDDIKENGFFLPLFRVIVVVLLDLKIDSFCFLSYATAVGGMAGGGIFGGVFEDDLHIFDIFFWKTFDEFVVGDQKLPEDSFPDGGFGSGEEGNGKNFEEAENIPYNSEEHDEVKASRIQMGGLNWFGYSLCGNIRRVDDDGLIKLHRDWLFYIIMDWDFDKFFVSEG